MQDIIPSPSPAVGSCGGPEAPSGRAGDACCTPSRPPADPTPGFTAPSPDTASKNLIHTMDALQQQQAHAESRRHSAEQEAAAAAAEVAALKAALLQALQLVADLDDREQAVQAALDARLQDQAQRSEALRLARRRLDGLRAEAASCAEEMQQKQALAADLQGRLRAAGIGESALAQLCSGAAQSCVGGAAAQQQRQSDAGQQRSSWLGGGGGLLASFRRRRCETAS